MRKLRLIASILVLVILLGSLPAMTISAEIDRSITKDNLTKLATAMNTAQSSFTYDSEEGFGTNFPIFATNNSEFANLFHTSASGGGSITNHESDSLMELSQQIENSYGISSQVSGDIPLPTPSPISLSSSIANDSKIGSSLSSQKYFSYQMLMVEIPTIVVKADWKNIDPTNYFEANFIKEYNNIKTLADAKSFLEKYGSHMFETYYFGGILEFTKSVVSEVDINQTYSENNIKLDLSANYSDAVKTASSGSAYSMENDQINNSKTKSKISIYPHGGKSPSALTLDGLFLITQQVAGSTPTSYPLNDWTRSIDTDRVDEKVIKAKGAVAIWDIVKNSSYHNDTTYSLLKAAYSNEYLETFAKTVNELDSNYSFISSTTSTNENGSVVNKTPYKKEITLARNSKTTFALDKTYLGDIAEVEFKLGTNAPDGVSIENNTLSIGNIGTNGFNIDLYTYGMKIDTLTIKVSECPFSSGSGTKSDPYVIKTAEEFLYFINDDSYYACSFTLNNQINLKGEFLSVGGSSKKVYYSGTFNGNGFTIQNATVISNSQWGLIGLFGANSGTISNLKLENIKCLNQGVINTKKVKNASVDAGILCGYNKGTISNISISNCAIKVSSNEDLNEENNALNLGGVVGCNEGKISSVSVTNANIYANIAHTNLCSQDANVGGIIGRNNGGDLKDACVANVNIKAINRDDTDSLGGVIGFMTKKSGASITYCVVYGLTINNKTGSTQEGYICGKNAGSSSFGNCIYDANISEDKSINGKSASGCSLKKGKLADTVKGSGWKNWTINESGNPVLK